MRLLAPVRTPLEAEMLLHHGADELYCGVTPPDWVSKFGGLQWLNRRSPAGGNLQSLEELARVVERGAPVYLALNSVGFTAEQADYLAGLAGEAVALGVRALIVADVGLMLHLRKAGVQAPFHVSTLGSAFNREALAFYADLGATRVVLPRQVTLDEVEALAAVSPVELEAFVLNDGCFYDEGSCSTTHSLGAFCLVPWEEEWDLPPDERAGLAEHLADYRRLLWSNDNCGSRPSPGGIPLGPCAMCALDRLHRAGVASAKIAGREGGGLRKIASVQFVRACLDRVLRGEDVREFARATRGVPEICDTGYTCYFR